MSMSTLVGAHGAEASDARQVLDDMAVFELSSPRPWTYVPSDPSRGRERDSIEDAIGNVVIECIGHLDGPLICLAVNRLPENS